MKGIRVQSIDIVAPKIRGGQQIGPIRTETGNENIRTVEGEGVFCNRRSSVECGIKGACRGGKITRTGYTVNKQLACWPCHNTVWGFISGSTKINRIEKVSPRGVKFGNSYIKWHRTHTVVERDIIGSRRSRITVTEYNSRTV